MRLPACLLSICVTPCGAAGPRTGQEFRHPIHHRRWHEEGDLLSRRILPGAELVPRREAPAPEHAGQALAALCSTERSNRSIRPGEGNQQRPRHLERRQVVRDFGGNIYVLPSSGGPPRQITDKIPSYFHGWSMDGPMAGFLRQARRQLRYLPRPVRRRRRAANDLTSGYDDGPEYSPDGKWIYFNSNRSGSWDIWRMPVDGAGENDAKAERISSDDLRGLVFHMPRRMENGSCSSPSKKAFPIIRRIRT